MGNAKSTINNLIQPAMLTGLADSVEMPMSTSAILDRVRIKSKGSICTNSILNIQSITQLVPDIIFPDAYNEQIMTELVKRHILEECVGSLKGDIDIIKLDSARAYMRLTTMLTPTRRWCDFVRTLDALNSFRAQRSAALNAHIEIVLQLERLLVTSNVFNCADAQLLGVLQLYNAELCQLQRDYAQILHRYTQIVNFLEANFLKAEDSGRLMTFLDFLNPIVDQFFLHFWSNKFKFDLYEDSLLKQICVSNDIEQRALRLCGFIAWLQEPATHQICTEALPVFIATKNIHFYGNEFTTMTVVNATNHSQFTKHTEKLKLNIINIDKKQSKIKELHLKIKQLNRHSTVHYHLDCLCNKLFKVYTERKSIEVSSNYLRDDIMRSLANMESSQSYYINWQMYFTSAEHCIQNVSDFLKAFKEFEPMHKIVLLLRKQYSNILDKVFHSDNSKIKLYNNISYNALESKMDEFIMFDRDHREYLRVNNIDLAVSLKPDVANEKTMKKLQEYKICFLNLKDYIEVSMQSVLKQLNDYEFLQRYGREYLFCERDVLFDCASLSKQCHDFERVVEELRRQNSIVPQVELDEESVDMHFYTLLDGNLTLNVRQLQAHDERLRDLNERQSACVRDIALYVHRLQRLS